MDLEVLKERYLGVEILLSNQEFILEEFVAVKNGAKIKIRDKLTNDSRFFMDSQSKKDAIFTLEYWESIILKVLKK
ncbi:hypothetical protein MNB_SV-13-574 [hydrothermal vent metagenome]|uniref:Uncharacterized protein n=1 Tax=hydrothermal vent metagenome TaxID=652676 RepID=A0A1W1CZH3_9ZZZZ